MAIEASTTSGQPGPSHAGTSPVEFEKNNRPPSRPPQERRRPPIN